MKNKTVLLLIIFVVGFVVVVCGCTSNNSNNSTGSGTQIEVNYSGSQQGNYGESSGHQSVDGTGTKKFDIPGDPLVVSACFQKRDASKGTLIVSILKDGKVVESKSTSAQYGVVSISK